MHPIAKTYLQLRLLGYSEFDCAYEALHLHDRAWLAAVSKSTLPYDDWEQSIIKYVRPFLEPE